MHQTRHRYIVVQESRPRLGRFARTLIYLAMVILALAYWVGFFYFATQQLDSERFVNEGASH